MGEDLDAIGRRLELDRSSLYHGYLEIYERIFAQIRSRPIKIVEFGAALNVRSLEMWKSFFPNATVIGVFDNPAMKCFADDRIGIEIGQQDDADFLTFLGAKYRPDIILDDGLHIWPHQVAGLRCMFPFLSPDGYYAIEDMQTNFPPDASSFRSHSKTSPFEYLQKLAAGVLWASNLDSLDGDEFAAFFAKTASSVSFFAKLCIIKKKNLNCDSIHPIIPM